MGRRGSIRPEVASGSSPQRLTAADAFAATANEIDALMAELGELLAGHTTAQQADPENWGHAGDLGNVRQHLANAVNFLKGSERWSPSRWTRSSGSATRWR